jgi:PAS domain S-box-containing protein
LARSVRDYAIFLLDPQGRITHWNEGAGRLKGYSEAEVLGRHVSLFYTPEQVAAGRPERQLQEAAAQDRSHEENWRVRKGGERFWGEELVVPLRDEGSGALLGFAKICQDLNAWCDLTGRLSDGPGDRFQPRRGARTYTGLQFG